MNMKDSTLELQIQCPDCSALYFNH